MGRSYNDFEAWLEDLDFYLDGPAHTDFDRDHSEAWENGLGPREYADILLAGEVPDTDSLYDESECWP